MRDDETSFPIEVQSPFINWLQTVILFSVKVLAVLMTLVVVWGVLDVGILIYHKIMEPPFLFINFEDILTTFGAFLAVLIAIEIFINIILYLRKNVVHIKLVVATALMAIARKVIVLDYEHTQPYQLFGIAAIIAALGISYWLVHLFPSGSNQKLP
ncbi:MAG: phosphate-starvation-inducible PsiE family protein [Parachlamydiaceae bacterium]|nr:phosphate-starvation-inducible PsiE family protein [Parachlamydiaceae bacterium]